MNEGENTQCLASDQKLANRQRSRKKRAIRRRRANQSKTTARSQHCKPLKAKAATQKGPAKEIKWNS